MKKILLFFACLYISLNIFGVVQASNSINARVEKFLPNKKPASLNVEKSEISNSESIIRNEEAISYEEELEQFFKTQKDVIKKETHDKELNFMAFGDFGYVDGDKPNPEMQKLADFIFNRVTRTFFNYDFFISLGDNFYPYGLTSINDKKAKILLEDTFKMSQLGLDWYPILGNHDLIGNYDAALKLHKKFPLWKQYEPYYYKIFNIGNSPLKAGFVFLNSNDLVCTKKSNPECFKSMWKNVKFDGIQEQLDYLDATLAMMSRDNDIAWKIVVIHNAIFSAGIRHGDNQDLIKLVLPILNKYKVDVVLSGHDHSVQYLRQDLKAESKVANGDLEISPLMFSNAEDDCETPLDPTYCSEQEFLHYELTRCGIVKSQPKSRLDKYSMFNIYDSKYSRESNVDQHEFMHQFVLGNGGTKHEQLCPVSQLESQGKLRYGHSVSGIGDIKIKEDRIKIDLISVDNELLYTVNIFKNILF